MMSYTNIKVCLTPETRLEQALKRAGVEEPAMITKLTVTGVITGKDFRYIGEKMRKTLQELDMSNADMIDIVMFSAFNGGCSGLKSISIPASMSEIDRYWTFFYSCSGLNSITAHPDNLAYTSVDGVLFNKDRTKLIFYPQGRKGDYVIPDSVLEIGKCAFFGCNGLTSVTIPNSVVKIGNRAFANCVKLSSVDITVTLTFETGLKQALKQADIAPVSITKLTVYGYLRENDLEFFSENMAETLQELDMSNVSTYRKNNYTVLNRGAINCSGLKSVSISAVFADEKSESYLYYFVDCLNLISITAHPDNPLYTSENGVLYDKAMTELICYPAGRQGDYVIPNSVIEFRHTAIAHCSGLTSVIAHPDSPVFANENGVLFNKEKTELICYPAARKGDYVVPRSVVKIRDFAFSGSVGLTSVTFPDTVVKIEHFAFSYCTGLTSITVHPDNPVFSSENGVLLNKEKTEIILYPRGRQGDYVIPDPVVEIGYAIFCHCTGLSSLFISASVTQIDIDAIIDCIALSSISVHPDNPVFSSENGVLFNKEKTEVIFYPQSRQGDYVIPDSVIKFGDCAFEECTGLTSVTIPA